MASRESLEAERSRASASHDSPPCPWPPHGYPGHRTVIPSPCPASLAGMSQLSGIAEMSLEKGGQGGAAGEPPRLAYRRADSALKLSSLNSPPRPSLPPEEGVWKEYVKADGRKWYYNTETRVMQWTVPEPFCKLDGAPRLLIARDISDTAVVFRRTSVPR